MSFPTRQTIVNKLDAEDVKEHIPVLYFAANPIDSSSDGTVCHWRVYLALSDHTSIRIDLAQGPKYGFPPRILGLFTLSKCEYPYSREAYTIYSVKMEMKTTAAEIVNVWLGEKRDQYCEGQGVWTWGLGRRNGPTRSMTVAEQNDSMIVGYHQNLTGVLSDVDLSTYNRPMPVFDEQSYPTESPVEANSVAASVQESDNSARESDIGGEEECRGENGDIILLE